MAALKTMLASDLIKLLERNIATHGDRPLFLRDADTGWRVELSDKDFECEGDTFILGHDDYCRIGA